MTADNPKVLNKVRLIQKCIIVQGDGKILALRRDTGDHSRSGCWDLPGGGYEQGEDVIDAIKREVREEAGLQANVLTPVYFANKIGVKVGLFAGDTVFAVTYVCRDWAGSVILSDEHEEYRWVTPEEFMSLTFGDDDGFFVASMKAYRALLSQT